MHNINAPMKIFSILITSCLLFFSNAAFSAYQKVCVGESVSYTLEKNSGYTKLYYYFEGYKPGYHGGLIHSISTNLTISKMVDGVATIGMVIKNPGTKKVIEEKYDTKLELTGTRTIHDAKISIETGIYTPITLRIDNVAIKGKKAACPDNKDCNHCVNVDLRS